MLPVCARLLPTAYCIYSSGNGRSLPSDPAAKDPHQPGRQLGRGRAGAVGPPVPQRGERNRPDCRASRTPRRCSTTKARSQPATSRRSSASPGRPSRGWCSGLEEDGLVRRSTNMLDGRSVVIRITPAGRRLLNRGRANRVRAMAVADAGKKRPRVGPDRNGAAVARRAVGGLRLKASRLQSQVSSLKSHL